MGGPHAPLRRGGDAGPDRRGRGADPVPAGRSRRRNRRSPPPRAARPNADIAASLGRYIGQNDEAFRAFPALFPPEEVADLAARSRAALDAVRDLLAARTAAGSARRCHGDLHLRNIALLDGRPVLFDGIEFDEDIATCDVLYDLAFLLMDLWERGLRREANTVLNRWLAAAGRRPNSRAARPPPCS